MGETGSGEARDGNLVKLVQRGFKLETHDDVPQDIRTQLYVEEQQYLNHKRKPHVAGDFPAGLPARVINNYIPAHPGQAPVGVGTRAV